MDTKLKKSHKWKMKNLIIALVILLPAVLLVSLYPSMERAADAKMAEWQERINQDVAAATPEESEEVYYVDTIPLTNYAVETAYCLYSQMLQEATGKETNTEILEYYGWLNDYDYLVSHSKYYAEFELPAEETFDTPETDAENPAVENPGATEGIAASEEGAPERIYKRKNASYDGMELMFDPMIASAKWEFFRDEQKATAMLVIQFDEYGKLADASIYTDGDYAPGLRESVKASEEQYRNNLDFYCQSSQLGFDAESEEGKAFRQSALDIKPKNFRLVIMLNESMENMFISSYNQENYSPYFSMVDAYFDIGAVWIILACALFVALAAITLPFIKKLETGREKLFCIPFEFVCLLIGGGICGVAGMYYVMCYTRLGWFREGIEGQMVSFELLGYHFGAEGCYAIALALNFLGWALLFFAEYICVAQLRQFFSGPKEYVKNRLLIVRFFRWCGRQCRRLVNYVMDIDINVGLHKSILKIVLVNFVVLTVLCCFWFFGIFGLLAYSIGLYVLLKKYGSKLQKQYRSILDATNQMAEGELHISLPEELGVFTPLGEELSKVQQGFSKAVAEEAKSQNMKSELITNVSHDLKTPLTAIITYVDLLKKENITEEERLSYIHTLDLKSQRLKVLIEDLFEVSKANSGNVKMNFMDVDIVNLMKEVRVEMEDKLNESNLDFRWKLPEEKVILSLDGQRTYRIFENILNNALKYAMPFTRVYVDMVHGADGVTVTFKNMSAQELNFDAEHLTERFVRGDSARNSEGSGLGLAIAKSFTELQGGEFKIDIDGDLFKVTIRFPEKEA